MAVYTKNPTSTNRKVIIMQLITVADSPKEMGSGGLVKEGTGGGVGIQLLRWYSSPFAEIERRPYHRNCSCALHKSKGHQCYKVSNGNKKISYPMRRSYSESCLTLAESPSSSPSVGVEIIKTKLEFFREEETD
ncbi:hypothetical protein FRX31_030381 [Thalictrum thalictroides]|uniref:Uncharacterized protein n=1 Tax=Thalictrum thalictroides TaxID=46969 RepID=A0A7J6V5K6_THATH|nr:hypothetical protein FRX31_030381 [Thalictrum thalictroides]